MEHALLLFSNIIVQYVPTSMTAGLQDKSKRRIPELSPSLSLTWEHGQDYCCSGQNTRSVTSFSFRKELFTKRSMIQAAAGHVEPQQECVSRPEHGLLLAGAANNESSFCLE